MARIELHNGVTLKGARRILTRRGSGFRLTLRHGRLYTFRKFYCQQPNSPAQIRCRNFLVEANRLAKEDITRPGRLDFWTRRAASSGYKTAIGCARAFFVARLKENSSSSADSSRVECHSRLFPVADSTRIRPLHAPSSCSSASAEVIHVWRSADFTRFASTRSRRKKRVHESP